MRIIRSDLPIVTQMEIKKKNTLSHSYVTSSQTLQTHVPKYRHLNKWPDFQKHCATLGAVGALKNQNAYLGIHIQTELLNILFNLLWNVNN